MNKCVKHAMLLRVALCINVTIPTYTMQVYSFQHTQTEETTLILRQCVRMCELYLAGIMTRAQLSMFICRRHSQSRGILINSLRDITQAQKHTSTLWPHIFPHRQKMHT